MKLGTELSCDYETTKDGYYIDEINIFGSFESETSWEYLTNCEIAEGETITSAEYNSFDDVSYYYIVATLTTKTSAGKSVSHNLDIGAESVIGVRISWNCRVGANKLHNYF